MKIKKEQQRVAPFLDKSDISGYTTNRKGAGPQTAGPSP